MLMGNDPRNPGKWQISELSKNGRQQWEIQPFVAKINLYHTKLDLSRSK
jgi:hypothetical protein